METRGLRGEATGRRCGLTTPRRLVRQRERLERECQEKARARLQEMGWANFEPRDDQQEFMYRQMIHKAEWLERTIIARHAQRRSYIEDAFERERMEAFGLGRQLFFDPRGPGGIFGFPQFKRSGAGGPETVKEGQVDPAGVVARMELTVEGCRWLLNEWSALARNSNRARSEVLQTISR